MFKLIGLFSLILATSNAASLISAELEVTLKVFPQAQIEETRAEVPVFKTLDQIELGMSQKAQNKGDRSKVSIFKTLEQMEWDMWKEKFSKQLILFLFS